MLRVALCAISTFGLAVVAHSARSQPVQQIAGTLAYMAPEQLRGHATAASDQYALGVLAYEWLAGSRPFSGSSAQVAVQQTLASPPPLREQVPTLPPLVERVVMRALAKDPDALSHHRGLCQSLGRGKPGGCRWTNHACP